jgi:hypothetical protein
LLSQIRQVRDGVTAGMAAGARAAEQVAGRLPGRGEEPGTGTSSVDRAVGDDGMGGGDHGAF